MSTDFKAGQLQAALQTKTDVLKSLIDLVPKETRGEALRLIEQLEGAVRHIIENSPSSIDLDIATASSTIEAVTTWLTKKMYPVTKKEIIEGVFASGYRKPKRGTPEQQKGNIKKTFPMHLEGNASEESPIKQIGALIGLVDWEKDRFLIDGNTEESLPPKGN